MNYLYLLAFGCLLLIIYPLIPFTSPVLANPFVVFGLIGLGAYFSALIGKRFQVTLPRHRLNLSLALAGGILMGTGLSLAKLPELGNVLAMVNGVFYWNSFAMSQGFMYFAGMLLGGVLAAGLQKTLYPRLKLKPLIHSKEVETGSRYLLAFLGAMSVITVFYGFRSYNWFPGILGIGLALACGFLLERNRICMALIMMELYFTRSRRNLAKVLGVVVFLYISWRIWVISGPVKQDLNWSTLLGAVLMGFGFMLAEGCFLGSLWKVGQGNILSLITLLGLFIASGIARLKFPVIWFIPATQVSITVKTWGVKLGVIIFLLIWFGAYFTGPCREVVKAGSVWVWLLSEGSLAGMLVVLLFSPRAALPLAVNLTGLLLFYLGIGIYGWARLSLGPNWGENIVLRQGHKIVTSGPYRYVKHPIYMSMGVGLAGLNLSFGSLWAVVWTFLIVVPLLMWRAAAEEKLLDQLTGAHEYFNK